MTDKPLNFPERGRNIVWFDKSDRTEMINSSELWRDQIRVSVERPATETSYSPEVETGKTIPYFNPERQES